MFNAKHKSIVLVTLFVTSSVSAIDTPVSANAASVRTYRLIHLERVVSNSDSCRTLYRDLQKLAKKPLTLQFAPQPEQKNFTVKETTGALINHSYTIAKQTVNNNTLNRVGLGSFEINGKEVDYVVAVSANANKANFKYFYPIIFAGEEAQCYYTALIKPDRKTIEVLKKEFFT
jgi:hypothetical protein